jgi:GntR family transcriptional regulator
MTIIDKTSPIPYYYQVYLSIRHAIENNSFNKGQPLPSERLLAEQYSINRLTIRKAIHQLIIDGFVYSVKGKGNFVKKNSIHYKVSKHTSFTQSILSNGLNPSAKLIEIQTIIPKVELAELLKLNSEQKVWSIYILRFADDMPISLTRSYIPVDRAPSLNRKITQHQSLYQLLSAEYGIEPTRASSICEVSLADMEESKLLSISLHFPLLQVTSTITDQQGNPIEQCVTRFRSDLVKVSVDL